MEQLYEKKLSLWASRDPKSVTEGSSMAMAIVYAREILRLRRAAKLDAKDIDAFRRHSV